MATILPSLQWVEILQNEELTKQIDIDIFQTLYGFDNWRAPAGEVASILGFSHVGPINLEIGRYAKRIQNRYSIAFTKRNEEEDKYWDLFFNGRDEGPKFIWQLRQELIDALLTTNLSGEEQASEDLNTLERLVEGIKKTIIVNTYERNIKAKELCKKNWGTTCTVCKFNFGATYGELGEGFIHVHHLIPVSDIGIEYEINPIKDLRPVCPNCHSMLHRKHPPLSIEELKVILKENQWK